MATNGSTARYKNDNKHQARSMHGTSSSFTNTYTLNVDKALKKKLDAAKRQQNVLYEYTRGGLVITADVATFELLTTDSKIYYEHLPESLGNAYITQSTDSTQRNKVQTTMRVHEQEQPAYTCTINLHLTSSRILVNGKRLTLFVERDITGIHDIIHAATYNGNQINLNKLNNLLAEQLQRVIRTNTTTTLCINSGRHQQQNNMKLKTYHVANAERIVEHMVYTVLKVNIGYTINAKSLIRNR